MRIKLLLALLVLALPLQAQFAITNHGTLVVSMAGSDTAAIRGRSDRPWRNPSNAIWAAQSGDRVLILNGNYTNTLHYSNTLTSAIKVWGKTNLTIEGSGPGTRLYFLGIGTGFQTSNSLNVKFRNFSALGSKGATSLGAGMVNGPAHVFENVGASRDIWYEDLLLENHSGHGIVVGNDTTSVPASDVTVLNCTFLNGGATSGVPSINLDGAAIHPTGQRWRMEGNTISNWLRGIEIYSNNYDLSNGVIRGNTILGHPFQGITYVSPIPRIMSGWLIEGNTIAGVIASPLSGGAGLYLPGNVRNCVIRGNSISEQVDGISIESSGQNLSGNVFSHNAIANCTRYGIFFQDGGGINTNMYLNRMEFNTISGCGSGGIRFKGNRTVVRGNTIINCAGAAIESFGQAGFGTNYNCLIDGNITLGPGISVTDASARTNRVINNQTIGVDISNTGTGTITNGNWQ